MKIKILTLLLFVSFHVYSATTICIDPGHDIETRGKTGGVYIASGKTNHVYGMVEYNPILKKFNIQYIPSDEVVTEWKDNNFRFYNGRFLTNGFRFDLFSTGQSNNSARDKVINRLMAIRHDKNISFEARQFPILHNDFSGMRSFSVTNISASNIRTNIVYPDNYNYGDAVLSWMQKQTIPSLDPKCGRIEADLNWRTSVKLKQKLETAKLPDGSPKFKVVITKSNWFHSMSYYERCKKGYDNNVDIFIGIHHNAADKNTIANYPTVLITPKPTFKIDYFLANDPRSKIATNYDGSISINPEQCQLNPTETNIIPLLYSLSAPPGKGSFVKESPQGERTSYIVPPFFRHYLTRSGLALAGNQDILLPVQSQYWTREPEKGVDPYPNSYYSKISTAYGKIQLPWPKSNEDNISPVMMRVRGVREIDDDRKLATNIFKELTVLYKTNKVKNDRSFYDPDRNSDYFSIDFFQYSSRMYEENPKKAEPVTVLVEVGFHTSLDFASWLDDSNIGKIANGLYNALDTFQPTAKYDEQQKLILDTVYRSTNKKENRKILYFSTNKMKLINMSNKSPILMAGEKESSNYLMMDFPKAGAVVVDPYLMYNVVFFSKTADTPKVEFQLNGKIVPVTNIISKLDWGNAYQCKIIAKKLGDGKLILGKNTAQFTFTQIVSGLQGHKNSRLGVSFLYKPTNAQPCIIESTMQYSDMTLLGFPVPLNPLSPSITILKIQSDEKTRKNVLYRNGSYAGIFSQIDSKAFNFPKPKGQIKVSFGFNRPDVSGSLSYKKNELNTNLMTATERGFIRYSQSKLEVEVRTNLLSSIKTPKQKLVFVISGSNQRGNSFIPIDSSPSSVGLVADPMSHMPWTNFTLSGLTNKGIVDTYKLFESEKSFEFN